MRNRLEELNKQLEELPELINTVELEFYKYQNQIQQVKQEILLIEVRLYKEGVIEGKNELTRNASILPHTAQLHERRVNLEYEMNKKKSEFTTLKNKLENTRIIAEILLNQS